MESYDKFSLWYTLTDSATLACLIAPGIKLSLPDSAHLAQGFQINDFVAPTFKQVSQIQTQTHVLTQHFFPSWATSPACKNQDI